MVHPFACNVASAAKLGFLLIETAGESLKEYQVLLRAHVCGTVSNGFGTYIVEKFL